VKNSNQEQVILALEYQFLSPNPSCSRVSSLFDQYSSRMLRLSKLYNPIHKLSSGQPTKSSVPLRFLNPLRGWSFIKGTDPYVRQLNYNFQYLVKGEGVGDTWSRASSPLRARNQSSCFQFLTAGIFVTVSPTLPSTFSTFTLSRPLSSCLALPCCRLRKESPC
jgi:hypothetical protein